MLLAKERQIDASSPKVSTKYRIAHASSSTDPELKPRYAESNIGNKALSRMTSAISFHSVCDGSQPVGLWAHEL